MQNSGHVTALEDQNDCRRPDLRALRAHAEPGRHVVRLTHARGAGGALVPALALGVAPALPSAGDGSTLRDRRVAAASAAAVADVLQRWWANLSGSDVGLRGGTWSYSGGACDRVHAPQRGIRPGRARHRHGAVGRTRPGASARPSSPARPAARPSGCGWRGRCRCARPAPASTASVAGRRLRLHMLALNTPGPGPGCSARGMWNSTVVPRPGAEVTSRLPPAARRRSRAVLRPMCSARRAGGRPVRKPRPSSATRPCSPPGARRSGSRRAWPARACGC